MTIDNIKSFTSDSFEQGQNELKLIEERLASIEKYMERRWKYEKIPDEYFRKFNIHPDLNSFLKILNTSGRQYQVNIGMEPEYEGSEILETVMSIIFKGHTEAVDGGHATVVIKFRFNGNGVSGIKEIFGFDS